MQDKTEIVKILTDKYELKENSYFSKDFYPYQSITELQNRTSKLLNRRLIAEYSKYIPKGWYGFDLDAPIPGKWLLVIKDYLNWAINKDPKMEIHQIKLKFGSIRIYLSSKDEEIQKSANELSNILFDDKLVY